MANPVVTGSASSNNGSSTGSAISITLPTGHVDGGIAFLQFGCNNNTDTVTVAPSASGGNAWTLVGNLNIQTSLQSFLYTRRTLATDDGQNITATMSANSKISTQYVASDASGQDTAAQATWVDPSQDANLTIANYTPGRANELLIALAQIGQFDAPPGVTPAATWTEIVDSASSHASPQAASWSAKKQLVGQNGTLQTGPNNAYAAALTLGQRDGGWVIGLYFADVANTIDEVSGSTDSFAAAKTVAVVFDELIFYDDFFNVGTKVVDQAKVLNELSTSHILDDLINLPVFSRARTFDDPSGSTDSFIPDKLFNDNSGVTDFFTSLKFKQFDEDSGSTDVGFRDDFDPVITITEDTATVTDTFLRELDFDRTFSDVSGVVDKFNQGDGFFFDDSGVVDGDPIPVKTTAITFSELSGSTDNFISAGNAQYGITFNDIGGAVDAVFKDANLVFSDVELVTDNFSLLVPVARAFTELSGADSFLVELNGTDIETIDFWIPVVPRRTMWEEQGKRDHV